MRTLISGQAASAIFFSTDKEIYSININAPEKPVKREEYEIPWILSHAHDVFEQECYSVDEVRKQLELAWKKDRALQLLLLLLDPTEDKELKKEASDVLNEFFQEGAVIEYVGNYMYSQPIPSFATVDLALSICKDLGLLNVSNFISNLHKQQDEIGLRHDAWEKLDESLFGGVEEKHTFHLKAIREGAFRILVEDNKKRGIGLVRILTLNAFKGSRQASQIFTEWSKPFITQTNYPRYDSYVREVDERGDEGKRKGRGNRKPMRAGVILERIEKQKAAIKAQITAGNDDQAFRYVADLIRWQRDTSTPAQIAKSLCDLGQFSKEFGSPELQLRFAARAIEEAPLDSWSHATMGDAFRALGEFEKAANSYQLAGENGDTRISMVGLAELAKDVGNIQESLKMYDKCIELFPADIVALNGHANVLASTGSLEEALEEYNTIISNHPYDAVTLNGRAQVLRHMGDLEGALKEIESILSSVPDDYYAIHSRGDVLRDLGRLYEAQQVFKGLLAKYPNSIEATLGYARACRDLGEFNKSIHSYSSLMKRNKWAYSAQVGMADTFRKMGEIAKAKSNYQKVIQNAPFSSYARNGMAASLIHDGAYAEALRLLSRHEPATISEWVAYHIRGMAYLKQREFAMAEVIFTRGIENNPWVHQRQYFVTALASLRIAQRQYEDALNLLKTVHHPSLIETIKVLEVHARQGNGVVTVHKQLPRQQQGIYSGLTSDISAFFVRLRKRPQEQKIEMEIHSREFNLLLLNV